MNLIFLLSHSIISRLLRGMSKAAQVNEFVYVFPLTRPASKTIRIGFLYATCKIDNTTGMNVRGFFMGKFKWVNSKSSSLILQRFSVSNQKAAFKDLPKIPNIFPIHSIINKTGA